MNAEPRDRSTLVLLAGLLASLALHLTVLWPWMLSLMSPQTPRAPVQARFEPEHVQPPAPEPLFLGIDADTPSSLTWIGREEYEEHMALLADVAQQAFDPVPSGATAQQPESPTPPPVAPRAPTAAETGVTPAAKPSPDPTPDEEQTPEKPPTPETPPGEKPEPSQVADLESIATTDVPWETVATEGTVRAGRGLQLKPRKPVFTTIVRFTAAPGNPKVTIRFRGDGRAADAQIDETSGDRRVDEAILNSLFRWRAAGADIDELEEGETVDVSLCIVLVRKRR